MKLRPDGFFHRLLQRLFVVEDENSLLSASKKLKERKLILESKSGKKYSVTETLGKDGKVEKREGDPRLLALMEEHGETLSKLASEGERDGLGNFIRDHIIPRLSEDFDKEGPKSQEPGPRSDRRILH